MAKKAKKRKSAKQTKQPVYWLSAANLRKKDTCGNYLERFVRAFGEEGGPINQANLEKAVRLGFPMDWLIGTYCDSHAGYAASDYWGDTALPAARKKHTLPRRAEAHAVLDTFAKYPPTELLPAAVAKKQVKAITQIKGLIKKHGIKAEQLGYQGWYD